MDNIGTPNQQQQGIIQGQQPPAVTVIQQQQQQQAYTSANAGHGSVGAVIGVLAVIAFLGIIAGLIGRLCSGRRVMGYGPHFDVESWLESKCSSCLDGHVGPLPSRMHPHLVVPPSSSPDWRGNGSLPHLHPIRIPTAGEIRSDDPPQQQQQQQQQQLHQQQKQQQERKEEEERESSSEEELQPQRHQQRSNNQQQQHPQYQHKRHSHGPDS